MYTNGILPLCYPAYKGHVYELGAAGGSLECKNLLTVGKSLKRSTLSSIFSRCILPDVGIWVTLFTRKGHQEIKRRIEADGVSFDGIGSCAKDCTVSQSVNADFGYGGNQYYSFGNGVPGQSVYCLLLLNRQHPSVEWRKLLLHKKVFQVYKASRGRAPL